MKTVNRGGKRIGAGRKPDQIKKSRITINVPEKHKAEILEKFKKIEKAYLERCRKQI